MCAVLAILGRQALWMPKPSILLWSKSIGSGVGLNIDESRLELKVTPTSSWCACIIRAAGGATTLRPMT